ncbi:MAG: inorganic diphosphatase [Planctomycetota bacterium]|nr:inorganic diphosphatase [Planctomycetota bacterium]
MKAHQFISALLLLVGTPSCDTSGCHVDEPEEQPIVLLHEHDKSYLNDYPAQLENGDVNVIVEIPAGTTGKWEVTKPEGELRWEIRDGKPRVVNYLGYPANYGMIPRTLLPEELGGDGDPLDVVILGNAAPRGAVIPARLIGVMIMIDDGEQDDKLIAVRPDSHFGTVYNLKDLETQFSGTTTILQAWFSNYKGPGEITVPGFADRPKAQEILTAAIKAYKPTK